MKRFKKWQKKGLRCWRTPSEYSGYRSVEGGWRGALECVRDKMLPNCHEPMDIYDFIEEELNE